MFTHSYFFLLIILATASSVFSSSISLLSVLQALVCLYSSQASSSKSIVITFLTHFSM